MNKGRSVRAQTRSIVFTTLFIIGLVLGLWWLSLAPPVYAATSTVTHTHASGAGSLRQVVLDAGAGDTIVFDPSLAGSTIVLTGDIHIDKDLTITGLGAETLTVSGSGTSRIFEVASGVNAAISGMTIRDGYAFKGGGLYNAGTLTVSDVVVRENVAQQGGGVFNAGTLALTDCVVADNASIQQNPASVNGGGIINAGLGSGKATLTIKRCTIENNSSTGEGGGVGNVTYEYDSVAELTVRQSAIVSNTAGYGGGVAVYAQFGGAAKATFINTTVRGNAATSDGGGYDVDILSNGTMARLSLIHTTVYSNTADGDGGGINVLADGSALIARNSLVAGNAAVGTGDDIHQGNVDVHVVFYGGNVIGSDEGVDLYSDRASDQIGTPGSIIDPLLGPFDDNGGATRTHMPLSGSPVIDAAEASTCTSADQRGASRPVDGDDDGSPGCDSGAVEVQSDDLAAVIRCDLLQGETVHFRATGLSAEIAALGTLSCLEVALTAENHPQASGAGNGDGLLTGRYWTITETAGADDWTVNLSLLHDDVRNPQACKYPGNMGGAGWDCDVTTASNRYVVRNGVTSFSDWAVGSDVSPTAVLLQRFSAVMDKEVVIPVGWLVVGGVAIGVAAWRWMRRP